LRKIKNKHPFEKIYVLTNYGTFSAASFVTYRLSLQRNCEIIGTETGGTASGCNAVLSYPCRLPQSRMKVLMPAFRFCHSNKEFDDNGRGIMPHYQVKNKPSYYFIKKDSVLNFTIQRIRESLKP
jgi:C-terminal processing protease CtpA/Prc